jgi:hypothetical protein
MLILFSSRKSWSCGKKVCFIFKRCRIQISTQRSVDLIDILRGFLLVFRELFGIVRHIRQLKRPSTSFTPRYSYWGWTVPQTWRHNFTSYLPSSVLPHTPSIHLAVLLTRMMLLTIFADRHFVPVVTDHMGLQWSATFGKMWVASSAIIIGM